MREIEDRVEREVDVRRAQSEEVFRDVDIGRGKSANEIQREILAAYEGHGYEPPSDFSRWSRFLAAGTGRWGTRSVRLIVEAARAVAAATKWSPGTGGDSRVERNGARGEERSGWEANNRTELGRLRRTFVVYASGAVVAAGLGSSSRGIVRIVFLVLAQLFTVIAAWVGLWALGVGVLVRRSGR